MASIFIKNAVEIAKKVVFFNLNYVVNKQLILKHHLALVLNTETY